METHESHSGKSPSKRCLREDQEFIKVKRPKNALVVKEHRKKSKHRSKYSPEHKASGDEEWVEVSTSSIRKSEDPLLKRDDWMTLPLSSDSHRTPVPKAEPPGKVSNKQYPGQHPRELNPYWKDGGTGLPSTSDTINTKNNCEGRSWILRSYKRALEQSKEKGVSFEEIAIRQWGSVEKIHSLLRSVGINPARPDHSLLPKEYLYSRSSYDEKKDEYPRSTSFGKKIPESYLKFQESNSKPFLRPGDDIDEYPYRSEKSSWKKIDQKTVTETPPEKVYDDHIKEAEVHEPSADSLQGDDCIKEAEVHEPIVDSLQGDGCYVTESMIHAVGAKLIKAEIAGKKEKIEKLQLELNNLRSRKKTQDLQKVQVSGPGKNSGKEKTILLTETDRFGQLRPAKMPVSTKSAHSPKRKSKKYFGDDHYSMKELMEEERRLTADDTYEAVVKMASKFVRSNADDVVDDVLDLQTRESAKESEKVKTKILSQSRRMEEIQEKCNLCINGSHYKKHLLVAMGMNTYLSVPSYQSLTEGHCLLVPIEHTTCSLQMDENVWSEISIFKKGLTKMFSCYDMDVIFSECYTSSNKMSHMYIDCIPIPKEEGSLAPMYFKKAILESDTEWAQNKKLVDTRQKGLRNSIPRGLPYFFVDFNNEGGFAHVIEDSSLFPHYFAKEIIGGIIDVEPRLWLKHVHESPERQKNKASKLVEMWKPYDWTQKLNQ